MPAPKGNLFALGNTGGRPQKYTDPKKFATKLGEYIEYEDSLKPKDAKTGMGKGIYTLEGAALFLGFASRESMYEYAKKEEFYYVVSRFKLFLTDFNVKKLYWGGTFMAAQFWLRNWGGYSEESTQNQNITTKDVTVKVVPSEVPIANNEKEFKKIEYQDLLKHKHALQLLLEADQEMLTEVRNLKSKLKITLNRCF